MIRETALSIMVLGLISSAQALADVPGSSRTEANRSALPLLEFFDAADSGQIACQFIPLNAAEANLLVRNQTDHVIHLQLPEAFAAVPVLAQLGPAIGQPGGGGGAGNGATQGVAGGVNAAGNQGFGNQGFGNQGFGNRRGGGQGQGRGFGFGVMRIAPNKTRKLTATTVCLEHGKAEPNPRIKYQMIPLAEFNGDPRVAKLCGQLGRGEMDQNTAQAVAWNLANKISWRELAELNRFESRYLGNIAFFSTDELREAQRWVGRITAALKAESDRYASNR